jgi:dynein heavy chain 1
MACCCLCVQDFIKHYATLFNEKRAQLEEQQRHISTGLRKLQDTQKDVFTLREGLQKKGLELEGKQKLANDTLEQIMVRLLA